jgi:hypothetical protein
LPSFTPDIKSLDNWSLGILVDNIIVENNVIMIEDREIRTRRRNLVITTLELVEFFVAQLLL